MSITINLTAPALRALIEDDATFALELRRSVVSEVVRNTLMKDGPKVLKEILPEVVKEFAERIKEDAEFTILLTQHLRTQLVAENNSYYRKTLPEDLKKKIQEEAGRLVSVQIKEAVKDTGLDPEQVAQKLWDQMQAWLEAETPKAVLRNVDREVERRIQVGVEERLAALKAAI